MRAVLQKKIDFDPDSGHWTFHLPESGSTFTYYERLAAFLSSALKVTPRHQVSLIFGNFQLFYHWKRLQMKQKLMAAVNHLSVTELKWPLQSKFAIALAFIWAIKREDQTVCYRDVWVVKVRTICAHFGQGCCVSNSLRACPTQKLETAPCFCRQKEIR